MAEVKRWAKSDLEAFVTGSFKTFCKEPCAECAKPATQRYKTSMSFVVSKMLESFWCNECGRVLCEKCRYQHTCERLDQQKERNKNLTHEQLAAQLAEAEVRKEEAEQAKKDAARADAEVIEIERRGRKDKRLVMAKKSKIVEDFLQGVARDTDANERRGARARDELFGLYTKIKRVSLTLYNEYEHPTSQGLPEEDYAEAKTVYARAKELTHMFVMYEDAPLDMNNPWDPPPPVDPADMEAALGRDGGGLGRGLL